MTARPTRRELLRTLATGSIGLIAARAPALAESGPPAGEILIRGGRLVNADGIRDADLRIVGERIAEIGADLRPGPLARVVDAAGRLVLPGGIDPHAHLHAPFADDLDSGSQAALAGGITTVGSFAIARAEESLLAAVDRELRHASTASIADVFLHAAAWPPTPAMRGAMGALAARGQPSIKLFMPQPDFHARLGEVIELLEAARDAGVVTMVHCEDAALLGAAVRRLRAAKRTSLAHYAESRPVVAEVAAVEQAAALCESTGAPVYVVHLSSARALEACRLARRSGAPFYVETRPFYLHLTEERLAGPTGPLFVGQPPLRTRADIDALWAGLADGSIDVLATDHAPWMRAQKLDPALSVSNTRPGVSDLQFMLPMYFSEGVRRRALPLERFVATTSTNAARIFGLYPRKGILREESDADVVIWDPQLSRRVRSEADRSRADYSPYEGWEVTGWPVLTIRRGQIVHEQERVIGAAGSGRVARRAPWRRDAAAAGDA